MKKAINIPFAWIVLFFCMAFLFSANADAKTVAVLKGESETLSELSSGTWTSSNTKVATIKSGKVTGKKTGTATLTSNKNKTIDIIVYTQGSALHVTSGSKLTLSGKCIYSRDESIAKICDDPKKIKGKSQGETNIFVNESGEIIRRRVKVDIPYFEKSSYFLTFGTGMTINAKGVNSAAYSYDDEYLYKENGKFYCFNSSSYGVTQITAKYGSEKCTCLVYIGNIIPTSYVVKTGSTTSLYNSTSEKLVNFTFKVSDTSIATISSTGRITGKKAGKTTISTTVNGKTYYCDLMVSDYSNSQVTVKSLADYKPYINSKLYNAAKSFALTYNVTNSLPASEFEGDSSVRAYIDISDHEIWTLTTAGRTALHEMGHFLNHLTGTPCYSSEFKSIYEEEGKGNSSYWGSHALSNYSEYFAEAYSKYITYPTTLKSQCPKTYNYIKSIESSITDSDLTALQEKYPAD